MSDRMVAPWPCPQCGGELVWAAAWSYPKGFVALVCEKEGLVFEEETPA